jgi:hypothetical protein
MNTENLIFLHIPKAAGSTLHGVLERHYESGEYLTITFPEQLKSFMESNTELRSKVRLLKGHMPYGMHEYLVGETKYITLLRNPVDRIVSHFYYVKRMPEHYLHKYVSSGMGLSDFVTSGISGELDNGQVRLLSGHDQDIPFGKCNTIHLENAKANIEASFAFAGISERFDESILMMKLALGWKWLPYYYSLNKTKEKPGLSKIDDKSFDIISKYNELDIQLYNWVCERFENNIEQYGNILEKHMGLLRRMNKLYYPFGHAKNTIKKMLKK